MKISSEIKLQFNDLQIILRSKKRSSNDLSVIANKIMDLINEIESAPQCTCSFNEFCYAHDVKK